METFRRVALVYIALLQTLSSSAGALSIMLRHTFVQHYATAALSVVMVSNSEDATTLDADDKDCDDECLAQRLAILEERRAMFRQSRTTTKRSEMFKVSRQRAALYNTTYEGASCPPNVPCF